MSGFDGYRRPPGSSITRRRIVREVPRGGRRSPARRATTASSVSSTPMPKSPFSGPDRMNIRLFRKGHRVEGQRGARNSSSEEIAGRGRRAGARRSHFQATVGKDKRLPARDIERERGGVRHVEALDRARQVEPRDVIAGLLGQLPQALALGAEHQRERRAQRQRGEIARRRWSRGRPPGSRAPSAPRARARDSAPLTSGTCSSAPEAALASTPVASGLWRAVVTMAVAAKAAAERKIAPTLCGSVIWSSTSTTPSAGKLLDRAARAADRSRHRGPDARRRAAAARRSRRAARSPARSADATPLVGEAARGVLGGEQLAQAPRRVLQRRRHRVPAVQHGGVRRRGRRLSRRARSNRSRRSTCSRVAPGFAAGLRPARCLARSFGRIGMVGLILIRRTAEQPSIDFDRGGCTIKPRESRPAGGRSRLSFEINAVRRFGRVSRAAKGADCKSAGLCLRRFESYLSHQPSRAVGASVGKPACICDREGGRILVKCAASSAGVAQW